jgi:hypothetical protein
MPASAFAPRPPARSLARSLRLWNEWENRKKPVISMQRACVFGEKSLISELYFHLAISATPDCNASAAASPP